MFSAAQLKAYLGTGALSVAEEAVLTDCELRAVELVEKATGRFFGASGAYTFYPTGTGVASIWIPDEITAVTSVSVRGEVGEDWVDLTVDDDYELDGRRFLRTGDLTWPDGPRLVKIVATRGYATDAEPEPIRQLVLDLVNWQFRAGRKLALQEGELSSVPGWERVTNLYKAPAYG